MDFRSVLAAAIALLAVGPTLASERFYCAADDEAIKLSIESGFSTGQGQKLIHFRGILLLKGEGAPPQYRSVRLKSEMLSQYWIDEKSLQLRLFTETKEEKPYAALDMSIVTSAVAGARGRLDGEYVLTTSTADNRKSAPRKQNSRTGRLSCNID